MPITKSVSSLYLLLSLLLVVSGCYKKESSGEETGEATATVEQKDEPRTTTTAPAESSKVDVNLYLEVSNGMKGFMPPAEAGRKPTEFQSRLNKMISEVQDGIYVDSKSYYLAKQDNQGRPVLDSVSYSTLKSTVVSGIKANVLGTPLPAMLQAALEKSVAQNTVSIIVSDFIHGPDPRDQGQFISLDSDIRSSLKLAEHKGLVVAVLADASSFYGSYYPAVKKPAVSKKLDGEEIPYYIWVIGKQQEVQVVTNKVLRNLPAQQAYFGFGYTTLPYSAVLKSKQFRPAGVVYCTSRTAETCTSVNIQPQKDEPVSFTIGVDLNTLPASMQELAYLKRNLKLAATGCRATIGDISAATEDTKAIPELAGYTHFVQVNVPELTANKGTLALQLQQVVPTWIENWSTENDNDPAADPKKTYQFNKIIDGVQALYRDQRKHVFSLTMDFNKAD
ncbi:hypothetical protein FVR03_05165 [Pontibacter qinzhouensis]|uniref:Uncharacterized protein n=1 Tax=Pontibacter qinzhouensis TaxID=2603253 RepID=A0A5C8KDK4_9BACT|nr:hypothetical protein [Pontibacter qinzhouensis]TXK50283.1 hypothetical protein FVR03_05165 [Pontibacter qinzhouensis]